MTRYLFVPFPMHGHVNPMIPVVAELLARESVVDVAVDPEFASAFAAEGARVHEIETPILGSVPASLGRRDRAARRRVNAGIRKRRARLVDEFVGRWPDWRPDVVVTDLYAEWGGAAARRTRTPLASFTGTFAMNRRMGIDGIRRSAGPLVAALLIGTGLIRIVHPAMRDRAALALVNTTDELQPDRASFDDDRYRFVGPLLRADEAHPDVDLPWDRLAAGPVIYVSSGTVYQRGTDFYRQVAEAFRDTEWTVVMATARTDPAELGDLPPNVHARQYVPQHAVLRHSDVFLTHAGMNSVLDAVRCGVPMLTAPFSLDQKGTAAHLEELGVGFVLGRTVPLDGILDAARRLAGDDEIKAKLARLAAPMATADPPGARAADALAEFAAARRPHAAART
ncbi:nucleotide disphospho-sugar-binding domain-containing protein [Plantactinospora endophytica]|uniref:Oleandomycin glycosyltransferase n=1 Tax=Plantactinospora endophytica TaxID=673535 RepID=A0ABQ4E6J5_9ACTN|nr:nucleotide disphospho-sugar-binding domain-containing protein [Plantactinospora endophytica]GIG90343.1 oleandomycin glycosyltransferase [Plantactinospora endophytica]